MMLSTSSTIVVNADIKVQRKIKYRHCTMEKIKAKTIRSFHLGVRLVTSKSIKLKASSLL